MAFEWPRELSSAATLLLRAARFAELAEHPSWDFGVELEDLLQLGVSRADLRYLICQGLLEHAEELPGGSCLNRCFQKPSPLTFGPASCFMLTAVGRLAATKCTSVPGEDLAERRMKHVGSQLRLQNPCDVARLCRQNYKPRWEPALRRLLFGTLLVKQFRTPAPNQHRILAAFEEEGWPARVDDPLPQSRQIQPQRRLHEAIAALNSNQNNRLIHFAGDGYGRGVCWFPVPNAVISRVPVD